jgi:hypothetical protein
MEPFNTEKLLALEFEEFVIAPTSNSAMLRWQTAADAAQSAADIAGSFIAAFRSFLCMTIVTCGPYSPAASPLLQR